VRRDRPHAAFAEGVIRIWERRRERLVPAGSDPSTLFFGGGTPSLASVDSIAAIVRAVGATHEVSLEANPHDLDEATVAGLRDSGVTRLSIGVQSFDPDVAGRLGRREDAAAAPAAIACALRAGFRSVSVDLIFAVPGAPSGAFADDLRRVLDAGVPHVSLYGLTIEDGTPFARAGARPLADDAWADLYETAVETLGCAGLHRYEVSNFAREGHRSLHNEHYWQARPWLGIGPGAHGWERDGTRVVDLLDVDAWLAAAGEGRDPEGSRERPEATVLATELLATGLRHVDGVDLVALRRWTRREPDPSTVARLVAGGVVTAGSARIALTRAGFAVTDSVASSLAGSLRAV
jgi:oxygen-independent coproporphyrinogen-3 oxidase